MMNDENVNVEHVVALKDVVNPLLFPFQTTWKDKRILNIGGAAETLPVLEEQFPEAVVQQSDIEAVLADDFSAAPCDYIVALGLKSSNCDFHQWMTRLLSSLTPGGAIAAGVYGYAGYYGLNMLSTIIKNFSADIDDISHQKNFSRVMKVAKAVIAQLPASHPARKQKAFMERLEKGDKNAFRQLIYLSADKIFTVSRLLDSIDACGGGLVDWVFPGYYNPARYVEDTGTAEKLKALPEPWCWQVAELVGAWPPEHYFFVSKKAAPPILPPSF
ncbi:MAG: hypothetical protein GTO45_29175 [Candidatus Aminicenantes bacterium]|nr:hypothetical protein [Candidatus Aminicenantes bacterium]NIM82865.1 hypothetical protein [Candidatus Aminicenantes bacterium]NIN22241.1 hypothetical protein [Candidatus Aminicenantes bacterium]NIN46009.1 hypothetical protein [Candidatus Aminicenantes bacterium]NIN88845.1 hypothetical protein [Candidatus Aminicenantes bacterium]